jgi:hypothetical protein
MSDCRMTEFWTYEMIYVCNSVSIGLRLGNCEWGGGGGVVARVRVFAVWKLPDNKQYGVYLLSLLTLHSCVMTSFDGMIY